MLVDHLPKACYPPEAIEAFRCHVAEGLAHGWDVKLVAYDDDVPDNHAFISAAVVATSGRIRVDISRHAGGDMVLIRFGESDPVPFEDLAVAKGELDYEQLAALASTDDPDDASLLEPPVSFDRILELLREWRDQLQDDLHPKNTKVAMKLRQIADGVAAKMFHTADH